MSTTPTSLVTLVGLGLLGVIQFAGGFSLLMVGYAAGSHPGAIVYNVFHNWFTALAVLGLGLVIGIPALQLAGWVLVAHVGGDRLAGYGLKYAPAFGDTHLGWIGRRRG